MIDHTKLKQQIVDEWYDDLFAEKAFDKWSKNNHRLSFWTNVSLAIIGTAGSGGTGLIAYFDGSKNYAAITSILALVSIVLNAYKTAKSSDNDDPKVAFACAQFFSSRNAEYGRLIKEIDAANGDWKPTFDKKLNELRDRKPPEYIPRSRENPKIFWIDDTKIVGDRIAKFRPSAGNIFA